MASWGLQTVYHKKRADKGKQIEAVLIPYRILCNDAQREGAKLAPELASRLFCYVPLHKIRYGIKFDMASSPTTGFEPAEIG